MSPRDDSLNGDELDPQRFPHEALGEDEKDRPLPADDPVSEIDRYDLFKMMRDEIEKLEADVHSRGDLKILHRTLKELRYAFKVYRPYRRRRKVTLFGSARTPLDHPECRQAMALCRLMATHGWMTITGAGGGIMEAGHLGAGKKASMGLNIMLPFEQRANDVIHGDPKLVTLKYFFTRKLMFVKETSAVVSLPGGFGTLDETFETLTLLQTGKQTMLPVVLLDAPGGSYWRDLGGFIDKHLLDHGMISPEDSSLYMITDSIDEAAEELCRFYRRYHSMRYVGNSLVIRMDTKLTEEQVAEINEEFSGILESGTFEQTEALPVERGEPELAHLPRLVFHFDRRQLGHLRRVIDYINDSASHEEACGEGA